MTVFIMVVQDLKANKRYYYVFLKAEHAMVARDRLIQSLDGPFLFSIVTRQVIEGLQLPEIESDTA